MSFWAEIPQFGAPRFWSYVAGATLVAVTGLWSAFTGLRRARLVEDVPTARLRSAPQGYVELSGEAQPLDGEPIVAPLSHIPCCWYRFKVERRDDRGWRRTQSGTSDGLFLLRDATGECVVDPEGAEITAAHKAVWVEGDSLTGTPGVHARHLRARGPGERLLHLGIRVSTAGWMGEAGHRYTEEVILPGDPLYAMGHLRTLGELDHRAARGELVRGILREWKRDPEALRARFDLDGDGEVSPLEWEAARAAAQVEAAREYREQQVRGGLNLLARPPLRDRPFLLSTLSQRRLVRRYRWRGIGGLALSLAAGGVALAMLAVRLGAA